MPKAMADDKFDAHERSVKRNNLSSKQTRSLQHTSTDLEQNRLHINEIGKKDSTVYNLIASAPGEKTLNIELQCYVYSQNFIFRNRCIN